ncbi:helix-turn-helix domain-containing protein [Plantactinospora sp. WMMB782]|uniref:helix-turn-helix domain-containing protein n=1 Tax=Plantactinospora sp. WMMB782 TaxID=3404121 RepID=UPI003B94EE15
MRSTVPGRGDATLWKVTRPARPSRMAGVSMAGFRDRGVTAAGQRVIPHPAVTLALEFGSGPLIVDDAAGRQQRGSLVAGLGFGSDALWVRGENFEAVQVRLSPIISHAILGMPPGDLNAAVVTLDDVWGRQASQVREQLRDAPSWHARFTVVDALLADRWQAGSRSARSSVDPEVSWAWKRILVSRGRARVDRLAAEVGWSRRRLWRRFHSQIGAAPKRAAKLIRFDHAIHRLVAGEHPARVAADCGYSDQSHLHRDVVAFTGSTPATAVGQPWLAVDDLAWPDRPPPAAP